MISPPALKKGDKIGIIAPARKISREEIQFAVDTFEKWGLKVVFGKNLFGSENQFSGSDPQRKEDLQKMLDDDSVKAIISARGGYGTLRIIDKIDFKKFKAKPKWIIGYSDITVLHSHIHQNFGVETLHATMCINFNKDEESADTLRKYLFGEKNPYSIKTHPLNRKGSGEGSLVGGNLSLLYALKGSRSGISTSGKILFIEDLDEYLYHIDRMMISLKRAGKLSHLEGLIIGGMTDMKDNQVPFGKTAEEIICESVAEFDYPVCFGFPAGHTTKNLALLFGRRAKLKVEATCSLTF
ncbi:MAG: LD-carboxypeptidase [Bacteroidetes bacterium]|nr:MAG: LD-carboxypeptidase [Bacteroidota bacterium]